MQTINVDGTTYTLKFDKDPIAWAKLARKAWKPEKPKDNRQFPKRANLSTREYVHQFESLNNLIQGDRSHLNAYGTAQYDPAMPLLEILETEGQLIGD